MDFGQVIKTVRHSKDEWVGMVRDDEGYYISIFGDPECIFGRLEKVRVTASEGARLLGVVKEYKP